MNAEPSLKRKRLTLQTKTAAASATYDSRGQETENWTDGTTYWASMRAATVRERDLAKQLGNDVTHIIETRYFGRVDPKINRFKLGSRIFALIGFVNVDERGVTSRFTAMESV